MGYRFSLKNANLVGHLVEGNILVFLENSIKTEESLYSTIVFDEFVTNKNNDYYTTNYYWNFVRSEFNNLQVAWEELRKRFIELYEKKKIDFGSKNDKSILEFLKRISEMLANCNVKTLLIPGFDHNELNETMIDPQYLQKLVNLHPENSVLILQPKEILKEVFRY